MSDEVLTLDHLLEVPEIRDFQSSKFVLHLKEGNILKLNGRYYECRIFCFDVDIPNSEKDIERSGTFKWYVDKYQLHHVELSRNLDYRIERLSILSYSKNTPEDYILISFRELLECRPLTP